MELYEKRFLEIEEKDFLRLSKKMRKWIEDNLFILDDSLNNGIDDSNKNDLKFWEELKCELIYGGSINLIVKKRRMNKKRSK